MAKKRKEKPAAPALEAPTAKTKVVQAYEMYQQLKGQNLKPKEIFSKIAETLGISERAARSYVWRAENPEKFKEMLDRYYAKRKAKAPAKTTTEEAEAVSEEAA